MNACKSDKKKPEKAKIEIVNYLEESKKSFDQRMKWWRDDRFGMFIHWGVYAVPAGIYNNKEVKGDNGEWIMNNAQIPVREYEKFAKQFNPTKFDANEWVKTMKDAGIKYVVITSKHHDGFGLWDSKVSNYDIVDFAPYGKDILKALSKACKKQGIKFGLYYSIIDWHHPEAQAINYPNYNNWENLKINPKFSSYLENYMKPQLKELIENYDPEIIWFDGEWIPDFTHNQGLELYQYIRSLKPNIIINNRVDKGRSGMQGMNKEDKKYAGDFGTPEQEILETTSTLDWESCMTMNDTWGYKKNDHNWKSTAVLVHNLIDVTAKGGNYLLNVGPTAEGLIPAPSVERLKQMGQWLKINGKAIYGTEKLQNNYKQGDKIRFTKEKGSPVYFAIVMEKPDKTIVLKNLKPKKDSKIILFGYDNPLEWSFNKKEGLIIILPLNILQTWSKDTYAWTFKITSNEI
ncbi:MAG: alpha-L-fucosidase [Flavobacteriaceae bacterium]|nr:alpha-L-fucosidase [Flavobacteriaceae bacterium]